jgi:hypothetical protein
LPSFIWSCGFGGICKSAPISRFVACRELSAMADYLPGESAGEYAKRLHEEMLRARGAALQAYSAVEQVLCSLCAALLNADVDGIGIIFFRIGGSLYRNKAIELLLTKKFDTQYDVYWFGLPGEQGRPKTTGLMGLIQNLDERRNHIVHWAAAVNLTGPDNEGRVVRDDVLQPQNMWDNTSHLRQLTVSDVNEFAKKAYFVTGSITQFTIYPKMSRDAQNPWHDIFRQPCTYPPSESHPLAKTPEAPETPRQSSGA